MLTIAQSKNDVMKMRRPTPEMRKWNRIHIRNLKRRGSTSKRKPKAYSQPTSQQMWAKSQGQIIYEAPDSLSLFPETANETIKFIRQIGSNAKKRHRAVIDFSKTKQITAAGAVYLYSEIDGIHNRIGRGAIRMNFSGIAQPIKRILRESGLIKLIHGDQEPTGNMLPIISGKDDDHIQKIVNYLINKAVLDQQLGGISVEHAEQLFGGAIGEAMLNVKYHAYPNQDKNLWWLTCAIFDTQLWIAFCDRGVGIPNTLPRHSWFEKIRKVAPLNDDAKMIQAAMEYARTSKEESQGRGLGSKDIQQLVLDHKRGHLTIVSGLGHYRLSGENEREETKALNADVGGTVIQWAIPMQLKREGL